MKKLGARKALSMMDGFDAEKYAMQDTRTPNEEDSDDDEPISLDTKEEKYVSYFNRIKHQIQRVWFYPAQAAQRGINGQLTLSFQVARDGALISVHIADSSGFKILDMAAIKAVREAAPYYPFPTTITKKKLPILATFVYSPKDDQPKPQELPLGPEQPEAPPLIDDFEVDAIERELAKLAEQPVENDLKKEGLATSNLLKELESIERVSRIQMDVTDKEKEPINSNSVSPLYEPKKNLLGSLADKIKNLENALLDIKVNISKNPTP